MNQELINFTQKSPIIQRADGVFVDLKKIELTDHDREVINAMYFPKIKDLNKEQISEFFKQLIVFLLKSTNSRKSSDEISTIHFMFCEEFPVYHQTLTVEEIRIICLKGVRGFFSNETVDSNLTLANFSKWKKSYFDIRNQATHRLINAVNSVPIESVYDFSATIVKINEIAFMKKDNPEKWENECFSFAQIIPSFMYDQLVKHQKIEINFFEKFLDEAKNKMVHKSDFEKESKIIQFLEVLSGNDFESYESKVVNKAKQLAIYNFIKNQ